MLALREQGYFYSTRVSATAETIGSAKPVRELDPFRDADRDQVFARMLYDVISSTVGGLVADYEDHFAAARDRFVAGESDEIPAAPWVERDSESPTTGGITAENAAGTARVTVGALSTGIEGCAQ